MEDRSLTLFSQRTSQETLRFLSLTEQLRDSVGEVLEEFNVAFELEDAWSNQPELIVTDVLTEVTEDLKRLEKLDAQSEVVDLGDFMGEVGAATILDSIELFYNYIGGNQKVSFQRSINEVFEREKLNWRLTDGHFLRILPETSPLQTSGATSSERLSFESSVRKVQQAQQSLEDRDYAEAVSEGCVFLENAIRLALENEPDLKDESQRPLDRVAHGFGDRALESLSYLRAKLEEDTAPGVLEIPREWAELSTQLMKALLLVQLESILEGNGNHSPVPAEPRGLTKAHAV